MKKLKKILFYYRWGARFIQNEERNSTQALTLKEINKPIKRFDVINSLLKSFNRETNYLEIGVRNPDDNFNNIVASKKISVDPGIEFESNPVDFKLTSDAFFEKLRNNKILNSDIKWDVIFIDGLHLADQVERDIENSLEYLTENGFVVLHDCNPPSEWHARENYGYDLTPAEVYWNGTTWKALFKARFRKNVSVACIDTDWGLGIIMKNELFPHLTNNFNPFYEFNVLNKRRVESLNLMDWQSFKDKIHI